MAELDKGAEVDVIYIDFQKAFVSVAHRRLLNIISRYGIRGRTLDWITAFSFNRKQRVVVKKSHSDCVLVISGVLQGSVLGPLLFVTYINSMTDGAT